MRKMLCVAVTSMGILFAGCNSPVFTPIASPNPWQDDYSFCPLWTTIARGELTMYMIRLAVNWATIIICIPPMPFWVRTVKKPKKKMFRWDTYKYAVPRTLSMGVCRLGFSGNTAGSCGVGTFTCRR